MGRSLRFSILSVALLWTGLTYSLTGRQIMDKQKELHKVKSEYESLMMVLVAKDGTKEKRKAKRWIKEFSDREGKSLLAFLNPSNIKGTALLNWAHKGKDDDQWIYLPAKGKTNRVASGSKRNYFMGTDFTYADLETDDVDNYKYNLKGDTKIKDKNCFIIEALPKNKQIIRETGYGKRILYVQKDIYVTVKVEFFNKRKKHIKTQVNLDFKNIKGTVYRPKKSIMKRIERNGKTGHRTLMLSTSLEVDVEIENDVFSERFLTKGKHLQ